MTYSRSLTEYFREEYIKLDNLLKDCLSSDKGVSEYIEQMERAITVPYSLCNLWNESYRKLKHIRYVRNKISHENMPEDFVKEKDLLFVKNFYESVLTRKDPLTQLFDHQKNQSPEKKPDNSESKRQSIQMEQSFKPTSSKGYTPKPYKRDHHKKEDTVSTDTAISIIVLTVTTIIALILFLLITS